MGISQTTTAIAAFLTGLLPASCHKTSPQQKVPAPAPAIAIAGVSNAPAPVIYHGNLGEIALTNHNETCLLLANGESCTLTPKLLDRHNVRITLAVENKNDFGETHDLSVTQVFGKPGKTVEVAVGDLNLTFVPRLAGGE